MDALLLLGPTGSGKTPLGETLQEKGLWGKSCRHFDFGSELRRVAAGWGDFTPSERIFVKQLISEGALLEDQHFSLAARLLEQFAGAAHADLLVLNGLPRHAGQAAALAPRLRIIALVVLEAEADELAARIRSNIGGDRAQRSDDSPELLQRKLAIFRERTAPLLAYYSSAGVHIVRIAVTARSTPDLVYSAAVDGLAHLAHV